MVPGHYCSLHRLFLLHFIESIEAYIILYIFENDCIRMFSNGVLFPFQFVRFWVFVCLYVMQYGARNWEQ